MAKAENTEKRVTIQYVCTADGCDYSAANVGVDKDGKPRVAIVKTRKGNNKAAFVSPPYGVVSGTETENPVCPVCGAKCTTVEDGRHKFLRLNSKRIARVRKELRLVGNTMRGSQYEPTVEDVKKVVGILYGEFDYVNDAADKRIERIIGGGGTRKRKGAKVLEIPFSL